MCRYPTSTIQIPLSYTQRIRTYNIHQHNTTPAFQTLVQAPNHSSPTPHTPPQLKNRHTFNNLPVPMGLVRPKPNHLIHSPLTSYTVPSKPHTHLTHSTNLSHPTHHTNPYHVGCTRHNTCVKVSVVLSYSLHVFLWSIYLYII